MKKRTSKDKPLKQKNQRYKVQQNKHRNISISPRLTLNFLVKRTECMEPVNDFKKQKIERILKGNNKESIKFKQIEHNFAFQQYLRKYYGWNDIQRNITELINRKALVKDITFIDFKAKNFKIMNQYGFQHKELALGKTKDLVNQTALSSTNQAKYLKELEICAHKISARQKSKGKNTGNTSTSFMQNLVKNIQKMIHNVKHQDQSPKQLQIKHILQKNQMNTPDISRIHNERVHTSPSTTACDNYGLFDYTSTRVKMKNNQNVSYSTRMQQKQQKIKVVTRFHTEYDTDYIKPTKQPLKLVKSKSKLSSSSKKSFSKKKHLPSSKSPSGLRSMLKLKKQ